MQEMAAVAVAFALIPVLGKKKIPIDISICIAGLVMALLGGLGLQRTVMTAVEKFTTFSVIQQLIVITEISTLGVLLKKYGIMDKMIDALNETVGNPKVIMMSIPALVGMLTVPGGAIISAPFVKDMGEQYDVDMPTCAAINLVFRHISMHIMPYATGFLLVASLIPELSIYRLSGFNAIFVVAYVAIAYFFFIRKIRGKPQSGRSVNLQSIGKLLLYTSPIYTAILLNVLFGIPFYIAMLANHLLAFLLGPRTNYFVDFAKSFNLKVLLSLTGVYYIQAVIAQFDSLTAFFSSIFGNPSTILAGIVLASFFFGFTTGFQPTAIGLVLPLLAAAGLTPGRLLMFTHMTFCWGFLGYFFSPLHLCQLFTCEFMGVKTSDLYRKYWRFFLALAAFLVAEYFVLNLLIV